MLLYIKEFVKFEVEHNLHWFNYDDNDYILKKDWAEKDKKPWMRKYISTTLYYERGAWMFDFMAYMFRAMVEKRDWSNYDVGVMAYSETLAKNHNWLLR